MPNPKMNKLWMRLGVSIVLSDEDLSNLESNMEDVVSRAIREGRAEVDGDTYFPSFPLTSRPEISCDMHCIALNASNAWIPTSERLPSNNNRDIIDCWITIRGHNDDKGKMDTAVYRANFCDGIWFFRDGVASNAVDSGAVKITAWMPVLAEPDPYEGE